MADTASQVISEAQGLLNDVGGALYTPDSLLPLLNKAYRELQNQLNLYGLRPTAEVAALQTIPANSTGLATPINNLLRPIEIGERTPGSQEQFKTMDERSWEPDEPRTQHLRVWTWREEQIYFLGATMDREIRIRYVKSLDALTLGSTVAITNALTVLAARTAALAARHIGENPTRASELDADAAFNLDTFIVTSIRQNQGLPTRRRRSRYRVPN